MDNESENLSLRYSALIDRLAAVEKELEETQIAMNHRLRETAKERDSYEAERNALRAELDKTSALHLETLRELLDIRAQLEKIKGPLV